MSGSTPTPTPPLCLRHHTHHSQSCSPSSDISSSDSSNDNMDTEDDSLADLVRQFVDQVKEAATNVGALESKLPQLQANMERLRAEIHWVTNDMSRMMRENLHRQNLIKTAQDCYRSSCLMMQNQHHQPVLLPRAGEDASVLSGGWQAVSPSSHHKDLMELHDFIKQSQVHFQVQEECIRRHCEQLQEDLATLKILEDCLRETRLSIYSFHAKQGLSNSTPTMTMTNDYLLRKRKEECPQTVPFSSLSSMMDEENPLQKRQRIGT